MQCAIEGDRQDHGARDEKFDDEVGSRHKGLLRLLDNSMIITNSDLIKKCEEGSVFLELAIKKAYVNIH